MSLMIAATARAGAFRLEANAEIPSGETWVVVGPNGAGKSTLVSLIAGLRPPCAGRVTFAGREWDNAEQGVHLPPQGRKVGLMPQGGLLFPHLSLLDNAAYPLRARGVSRGVAQREARLLLERLGVGQRATARPTVVSGGEAARAALARALAARPEVLLLDEPLAAIDERSRRELRAWLRQRLAEFPGVRILVTHDPAEAAFFGDRIAVLEEGRLTRIGTAAELARGPQSQFTAAFFGANHLRGVLRREGEDWFVESAAGRMAVIAGDRAAGEEVLAVIRPPHVALYRHLPEGSPRNRFAGEIASLRADGGRVFVELASTPRLVAEITPAAAAELRLVPGEKIWATFKAAAVELD